MRDKDKYPQPVNSSNGGLFCPCCYGGHLHQGAATVFNRMEDDRDAVGVRVDCRGEVSRSDAVNPSPRRDAVTVDFDCEQCDKLLQLCIVQHKGETFLYWRDMPA